LAGGYGPEVIGPGGLLAGSIGRGHIGLIPYSRKQMPPFSTIRTPIVSIAPVSNILNAHHKQHVMRANT